MGSSDKSTFRVEGIAIEAATAIEAKAILETRRDDQRAKESRLREVRGDVFATREEADAACGAHDKALGLPSEHMDRWTEPVPLVDGWLVQRPDRSGDLIDRSRMEVADESDEKAEAALEAEPVKAVKR